MKVAHIYAFSVYENYGEGTFEKREDYLEVPKLNLEEILNVLKKRIKINVDYDFLKEKLDNIDLRVFGECPIYHRPYVVKVIVYVSGYYDEYCYDIIVISDAKEVAKELFEKLKERYESFKDTLTTITEFMKKHNLEIDILNIEKGVSEGEFYYIISSLKKC